MGINGCVDKIGKFGLSHVQAYHGFHIPQNSEDSNGDW